jgi:hypothetical protein
MSNKIDFASVAASASSPEEFQRQLLEAISEATPEPLGDEQAQTPPRHEEARPFEAPKRARTETFRESLRKFTAEEWSKPSPKEPALFEVDTAQGPKLWLPENEVGLLTGTGGRGKTAVLAALACSCATGLPAFGVFKPQRVGRVLLNCGEERQERLRGRIADAARISLGVKDGDPLPAHVSDALEANILIARSAGPLLGMESLSFSRSPEHLYALGLEFMPDADSRSKRTVYAPTPLLLEKEETLNDLSGGPWVLVVCDPLVRFNGADENDNVAAAALVGAAERLRDTAARPAILLAHHTAKGSSDARGASAFRDNTRWRGTIGPFSSSSANRGKANPVPAAVDLKFPRRELAVERNSYGPEAPYLRPVLLVDVLMGNGFALRAETAEEERARQEFEQRVKQQAGGDAL